MTVITYSIPAIHCAHCTHTIEMELSAWAGVQSVMADLAGKKITVTFEAPADEARIMALLTEIEYPVAA